jgi:16S rRNA (uracil1498-N3)-methyltransferase
MAGGFQPFGLIDAVLSIETPPSLKLILLQASIEEHKLEETLKRGTEFGIDRFVIFNAHLSLPFVQSKLHKRLTRLQSLIIDAARQSGRLFVPSIEFASSLAEAIDSEQEAYWGIYGDPFSPKLMSSIIKTATNPNLNAIIAVGPEGGFSTAECDEMLKKNFLNVRWAPFTLRTELAALAPISLINALWSRA